MLPSFTFHHLGVACQSLDDDAPAWQALGYAYETPVFVDEAQGIRGQFLTGGGPRLELLESYGDSSTLAPWLKRRVKIYHSGYLVPDLEKAIEALEARGATLARAPLMSTFFKAPIAFMMLPNMALVELIASAADANHKGS